MQKPNLDNLKPGAVVVLGNAVGGSLALTYATVLTIGQPETLQIDDKQEEIAPPISVAFIPDAGKAVLGKSNWHDGFLRIADVLHSSHPDVQTGRRPIFWIEALGHPSQSADVNMQNFPQVSTSAVLDRMSVESYREPGEVGRSVTSKSTPLADDYQRRNYTDKQVADGIDPLPGMSPQEQHKTLAQELPQYNRTEQESQKEGLKPAVPGYYPGEDQSAIAAKQLAEQKQQKDMVDKGQGRI